MKQRAIKRRRSLLRNRFQIEPLESRVLLTVYPVTTTADTGAGSLRQAILNANGHAGLDSITFSISGSGVHVITPASALPSITSPVTIDGSSESGYAGTPLVQIKGSSAGTIVDGLVITAGGTTINALDITNCSGSGISMFTAAGGNLIENCFIGTDPTGTSAAGNFYYGVVISGGCSSNQITSNLISGNGNDPSSLDPGVAIFGTSTNSNTVSGNKIGTDVTGTKGLGNAVGIAISSGASFNTISGNLVSGNGISNQLTGIQIFGSGANSNVVIGNKVGTDITGTKALGNGGEGISISGGAQLNRIGTNGDGIGDAAERNIISANGVGVNYAGVDLNGTGTTGNIVAGNFIGTDVTGTIPLGNGGQGVFLGYGAQSNRIGVNGADVGAAAEANVISANGFPNFWPGIEIYGSGTNQNVVAGNDIGTDVTGLVAMGNEGVGVYIHGSVANNRIGTDGNGVGDLLERNLIDNSGYQGVYIGDLGTTGNVVAGNYIGASENGSPMGNANNGIWIDNSATNNRIGTNGIDVDAAGEGNLIIANAYDGIIVTDPTSGTDHTNGNSIRANSIHNNGAGYVGLNLNGDFNLNHGTAVELGPNNFENYPQLTGGTPGAVTVVTGSYTGPTNTAEIIDFYANANADSPFDGTGDRWLGSITVNTGATGTVSFTANVGTASAGQSITATGTDAGGNTSEFSPPVQLPSAPLQLGAGAWTPIGPAPIMESNANAPTVSGRVDVAVADPTDPNVAYIAADGGGIWKTTDWLDAVPQWTPLTDTMPSIFFNDTAYMPLAMAPSNKQILYATVMTPAGGILKSTNGGATWTELANATFDGASFGSIVVDPTNANNLYASVWYGATSGGGVYKSTDGGNTWTNTTASIHNGAAADLVINPSNPSILYAGLVGDTTSGGAHNGIYETINGGASWNLLTSGVLSGSAVGVSVRLAISPSTPNDLYATVFDPSLGNLPDGEPHRYKTTNGGTSWTSLSTLPSGDEFRYWHALLAIDPHNPSIVYVNGDHTLFQSTDSGTTWTQSYDEDPVNVTFDSTGAVIMTGDRGLYRWTGGASVFQNKHGTLSNVEFYNITLAPNDPLTVYGIAQDQIDGLKTTDSPVWTYMGGADEVGRIVVDPTNPNLLYEFDPNNGGTPSNSDAAVPGPIPLYFVWTSTDGGANWTQANNGIPTTNVGFNLAYTSQRAFVMDPSNHNRLLLGLDSVYETTNGAASWTSISPILSPGQFISSVAIAPSAPNTVYAATGDGKLFVTTNDSTWNERDTGLPLNYFGHVMDIQVDPANPLHAFVACGGFLEGDTSSGHVFVTNNGGVSWTNITGNLPSEDAGQTIAVDWRFATPRLYIGTLRGAFLSTDLGAHWSAFGANLPNTIVTDLELSTTFNVIAASTYGRGAFEMRIPAATSDVITGTAAVDGITLVQDYDHLHIDWTIGNTTGQMLITDAAGLTINGNGLNDTVFLDYTNGNPLPNKLNLNGIFTINNLATTGNPLAGTTVDIERSKVFINYGAPANDPIAAIKGYLATGYNAGAWNGTSANGVITSSAARASFTSGAKATTIGYADSADGTGVNSTTNTVELMYTLYADADLSGQVNANDLQILLNNFNQPSNIWTKGDFDFSGSVNANDLQKLLNNFNITLTTQAPLPLDPTLSASTVPLAPVTSATTSAQTTSSSNVVTLSANSVTTDDVKPKKVKARSKTHR